MSDNNKLKKRSGVAYLILTWLELPFVGMYAGTAPSIKDSGDFRPIIEMASYIYLIPFGILCLIGAFLLVIGCANHNQEQNPKLEPLYKIGLIINAIYLAVIFAVAIKYG